MTFIFIYLLFLNQPFFNLYYYIVFQDIHFTRKNRNHIHKSSEQHTLIHIIHYFHLYTHSYILHIHTYIHSYILTLTHIHSLTYNFYIVTYSFTFIVYINILLIFFYHPHILLTNILFQKI